MLFVLVLFGWIFVDFLYVNVIIIVLIIMVFCIVLSIVFWDDVCKNKVGWDILIWYGGIIGMLSILDKVGFFMWLVKIFENYF